MRAGGAGWLSRLLLTVGCLLLVGLQALQAANVTAIQDPGMAHEDESEVDEETENDNDMPMPENEPLVEVEEEVHNRTVVKEVEFGMCTVTCGVGIREVILTNGCPGGESKCIVRVEECRGPVDCGWGRPISESLESVRLSCVHISPENRFRYMWKLLKTDQQPVILANDSAVLEVQRELHPMAFECDTLDNNEIIASVKFTVYTTNELQMRRTRPDTDAVLVFVLTVGVIICVFVIFVLVFIIINWLPHLVYALKNNNLTYFAAIGRAFRRAFYNFTRAAVKSFWVVKGSSTEIHSEMSSMRYKDSTSLDQSPTDMPGHEDDALSEWNE